jgi:hypothetical protein
MSQWRRAACRVTMQVSVRCGRCAATLGQQHVMCRFRTIARDARSESPDLGRLS